MPHNLADENGQISVKQYVDEFLKDILDQLVSIVAQKFADINNNFFSRDNNSGTSKVDTEYKLMNQIDFTEKDTDRKLFSIKISGKVN